MEILVGRVGRAHGIRGDVVIDVHTDEPDRRFAPGTGFATRRGHLTIAATHWHGTRLLASFAGVTDRAAAQMLGGVELRIDVPQDEHPDDPAEFYDHQLVGLSAETVSGELIGPVTDMLHLPSQDVLVVDHEGHEILIPFVTELVPTVDLPGARVLVVDQPGLLSEQPPASSAERPLPGRPECAEPTSTESPLGRRKAGW